MTKLFDALHAAGMRPRKTTETAMSLTEARILALSARGDRTPDTHHNEALSHLPAEFSSLGTIRKGEEFMRELRNILDARERQKDRGTTGFQINRHTVFGLSQLVHARRDALQGSRRKSFDRLIPQFLAMKGEFEKNPDADALQVLQKHLSR